MPETTRRRNGELVRALFEVIGESRDDLASKDALERLEDRVQVTPFEDADYPNRPGVRRFPKIVRFATIGPVKAGWMTKRRGTWAITDAGREALRRFPDPEQFFGEAMSLYQAWRAEQPDTAEEAEASQPSAAATLEEAEETAWAEVQAHLQSMSPYDFQDLVAALLEAMGYHVQWTAPPGPDRGIDILATTDPLGASSPRVKVQVKRRADSVAVDGLRAFLAVLGDDDVGIFVSAGGFTRAAELEARQQERRRVTLIDQERLFDLWVEYYERTAEASRQLLPLRSVSFLAPTT